jgi:hypothetical protein
MKLLIDLVQIISASRMIKCCEIWGGLKIGPGVNLQTEELGFAGSFTP